MSEAIKNRYEFVILFDVENGNPNGDPDAGNLPRIDFETGQGLVTDVCIKRKIRNYVEIVKDGIPGFDIYVKEGIALNDQHNKAYSATGLKPSNKLPKNPKDARGLIEFMCSTFYDIRTFGAVMSTSINCGQVRGPIQMNFAKSIDPIFQQEVGITRVTVTRRGEEKETEIGRKMIVPYGLYRMEGYVSANLARKTTGFSEEDLELFWESITNMFEHDHSASRGKMVTRKLFIFKHDSPLGNYPSHKLFELIDVKKINDGPPRSYSDYEIVVKREELPSTVELLEKI